MVRLFIHFVWQGIELYIGVTPPALQQVLSFCLACAERWAVCAFHKYLILVPSDDSPFSQDAFLTARSGVMSQPYRCPFCFAHSLPVLKEGAGDTLNSEKSPSS